MNTSRHAKYLDNVKHPARKGKNSREMMDLLGGEPEQDQAEVTSQS